MGVKQIVKMNDYEHLWKKIFVWEERDATRC